MYKTQAGAFCKEWGLSLHGHGPLQVFVHEPERSVSRNNPSMDEHPGPPLSQMSSRASFMCFVQSA
eukprot:scaffold158_cov31-Attheya_sp.AAC.1